MRTIDGHCLCQEGVIQKLHESHQFICSHPFEKKMSQEPIGQQQQSLGINNVETETAHKRKKSYSWSVCGLVSFSKFIWYFMQSTASQTGIETPSNVYFHVQHFILDFL